MMTLKLMQEFFESVDDQWQSPIASSITSAWFSAKADTRVLRASANFVCLVNVDGQRYYLRFNHDDERQSDFISAELDFILYVASHSISVNQPIPSLTGRLVETVPTDMGPCHAVMFEALPGEHREFDSLSADDFETWGRTLGQLHACSSRLATLPRPSWEDHLDFAKRTIPESEQAAQTELTAVELALHKLPQSEDNFGLIHYDFELDNLTWHDGMISALDFDDCAYYRFAADIAYALRDLFHDSVTRVDFEDASFQAFIRGYRTAQWLSDEDLERIGLYLRLHNLYSFARIIRATGDKPITRVPPWAIALHQKLNSILDKYRMEFVIAPI